MSNTEPRCLIGCTDVAIGEKRNIDTYTVDKDKILLNTTIIGEMKRSFDILYNNKSGIIKSIDQLLAEVLDIIKCDEVKRTQTIL